MTHLDFDFEIKRAPDGEGRFSGLASVFGNVDRGRDIVMPGAFRKSLEKRPAHKVRLLAFHNPNEPIGVIDRLVNIGDKASHDVGVKTGQLRLI